MMDRALVVVVGIEQYANELIAPSLPTAGPDAIRIAVRLQEMGARPENTFVFLAPTRRGAEDQARFDALLNTVRPGTHVNQASTFQTIDVFWRQTLREIAARQVDGRLFLYWCGHGFTDAPTGLPVLLYPEWTEALKNRVLHRIEFLESLHSQHYRNLSSQLILFDACANPASPGLASLYTSDTWEDTIDQVCISAAARGEYAGGDDRTSHFARMVVETLNGIEQWPDLDAFSGELERAIQQHGKGSTPVLYRRGRGDDRVWRPSNPAREDLVDRLMKLPIAPTRLKPLYLSVISALASGSGRGKADGIPQMIDILWNANGRADAAAAPYPAVEFALRVRKAFDPAAESLAQWIDNDRFVAPADREEARLRLSDEQQMMYLVVEIIESKSSTRAGQIEKFRALLLDYDHARPVEPWTPVEHDVASWQDLEEKIRPLLNQAHEIADTRDVRLTIEFATNVFDIDPHRISLTNGAMDTIGEAHPVVLRLRTPRMREVRQPWIDRAVAIREGQFKTELHRVTVANPALQSCRVLFVGHALPRGSCPAHPQPLTPEWQLLRRSINAGVPFIFWPLRTSANGDCEDYEQEMVTWVESHPVDRIPGRVREARGAGTSAADVNVFWDDPLPTWQLREIRTR